MAFYLLDSMVQAMASTWMFLMLRATAVGAHHPVLIQTARFSPTWLAEQGYYLLFLGDFLECRGSQARCAGDESTAQGAVHCPPADT